MTREKDEELFDLGFDEEEENQTSNQQRNYNRTEILPEVAQINGGGRQSEIHGSYAERISGRSSSPLLFAQASTFPECTQLRAWKIVNGIPTGLGVIDAGASEEEFVQRFRNAMPKKGDQKATFKLRPLDIDGQELGQEITTVISEHHSSLLPVSQEEVIQQRKATQNLDLHNSMVSMLRETLSASQQALEEERRRTQNLMSQMAQERIDLANNTATGIQTTAERMLNADNQRQEAMLKQERERNRQAQDNMASFFQSNLEVLQTERERAEKQSLVQMERDKTFYDRMLEQEAVRREAERAETRQRLEMIKQEAANERLRLQQEWQLRMDQEERKRSREQAEHDRRIEIMRKEWELKKEQEKEEYERREAARRREADERRLRENRDQKEKDSERQRQHTMKMKELELAAQRDKEHAERMMQLQLMQFKEKKESGIGNIKGIIKEAKTTLESLGVDPRDVVDRILGNDSGSTGSEVLSALTKIAGNATEVMTESIRAKAIEKSNTQPVPPYNPMMYQQKPNPPPTPTPKQIEQKEIQSNSQQWIDSQNKPEQQNIPDEPQVDLKVQRSARKALRVLVNNLKKSKTDKWEELITVAITNEFSIYHYCNAVSVQRALIEAGAEQNMINVVIDMLTKSSLVPNDMRMR